MKKAIISLVSIFAISCAAPQHINNSDEALLALVDRIGKAPESIEFSRFWNQYLNSGQVLSTVQAHEQFTETMSSIERGEISCEAVDWRSITTANVFSLPPRLAAAECLESAGKDDLAAYHRNIISFIASGILSPHSGDEYYSAYEIAGWADAEDLLALSGFEIIDSYFEFQASRNGLYRVYNVRDRETGKFSRIYFENLRFLHRVIGGHYPFAGLSDALFTNVIQSLADSDYAARHAEATVHHANGEHEKAEEAYIDAISMGSVSANIGLGQLCMEGNSRKFGRSDCPALYVTASELGLENAKVPLAYIMYIGLGVEKDAALSDQLLESASAALDPGQAEFEFSALASSGQFAPANKALSRTFLERAVQQGYPPALFQKAMTKLGAIRQTKTSDAAIKEFSELIETAAAAGYPPAKFIYSQYLLEVSRNINLGLQMLDEAASDGLPTALFERGRVAEWGLYTREKDELKAFLDYEAAAVRWHPQAQLRAGLFNTTGKAVEVDHDIAYGWYSLCAEAGNLDCITNLGYAAENGLGVEKNPAHAAELYQLAAESGHPRANHNLGQLYRKGVGVEQDTGKSIKLFTSAAENGWADAMNALGLLYLDEAERTYNTEMALHWFERAAEENSKFGFYNQARMYDEGVGVQKDRDRALKLYQQASDRGHGRASLVLAKAFEEGDGFDQDIKQSVEYYRLALRQGESEALNRLRQICTDTGNCSLTVEDILRMSPLTAQ
ncbi:tetratricopeptide repeat protein [Microbulbifer sediminum]|uniref:tetratricopeptide repeat protein n=1 Tax=Microbulbifer sediminum TaxID=2904250 RepID=UPI001F2845B1|nr:tetratricopeptide repeat protein [Microbulbifer sediminum]